VKHLKAQSQKTDHLENQEALTDVVKISADIRLVDNSARLKEVIVGKSRLEPTRYGDWEKNGRCIDF